jgi:hypothetical protein
MDITHSVEAFHAKSPKTKADPTPVQLAAALRIVLRNGSDAHSF